MKGRLTVVLDLDGTLISSFTPRRAPSLHPGTKSYVVGRGAKLNPNGVLVVERPELGQFFRKLNEFAGESGSPVFWMRSSHPRGASLPETAHNHAEWSIWLLCEELGPRWICLIPAALFCGGYVCWQTASVCLSSVV